MLIQEPVLDQSLRNKHEKISEDNRRNPPNISAILAAHRASIPNTIGELEVIQSDSESAQSTFKLESSLRGNSQVRLVLSKNCKSSQYFPKLPLKDVSSRIGAQT